jgi:hypothetical protein
MHRSLVLKQMKKSSFSLCEIRIYTRDCSRESQNPNLGRCASQSDSPDKDFLISDKGEYTFYIYSTLKCILLRLSIIQNPNLGRCASQSDSPDKDFLISDKGEYTFYIYSTLKCILLRLSIIQLTNWLYSTCFFFFFFFFFFVVWE